VVSIASSCTYDFKIPCENLVKVASSLMGNCRSSKGRDELQFSQRSSCLRKLFIEVTTDYNPGLAVLLKDVGSDFSILAASSSPGSR
jgi:hypothetical protein